VCEECGCEPVGGAHGHEHEHHHDREHDHNNAPVAQHNREHFRAHGVVAVNVVGSSGSGKTALLEATARATGRRFGVISADLATDRDAQRLRAAGIPAVGIATGAAWHVDAAQVHQALHGFPLQDLSYLFIENVGDLIVPATHDLGQTLTVVVLSVTEGDDKPYKFPVTFRKADLVVLTKIDLLPHLPEVRVEAIAAALDRLLPRPALLPVSARDGQGMNRWVAWLEARTQAPVCVPAGPSMPPSVRAVG
jgi:hydrogenase nickel incorporation protein HypB